jgi:hypothetical protein
VVLAVAAAADAADNEAASAMKAPVSVVAVFGTAVQRSPSIEVIENPAGRVAMMEIKATPVAVRNVEINLQGIMKIEAPPRPSIRVVDHSDAVDFVCSEKRRTEIRERKRWSVEDSRNYDVRSSNASILA